VWPGPIRVDIRRKFLRDAVLRDVQKASRGRIMKAHRGAPRYKWVFEIYSLIVRTTLEVGRVSVIGPFSCFRMDSS
jgi:hypothetical protein